jgi:hypothetical protein
MEIAVDWLAADAPVRADFPPGPDGSRRLRFVAAPTIDEVSA